MTFGSQHQRADRCHPDRAHQRSSGRRSQHPALLPVDPAAAGAVFARLVQQLGLVYLDHVATTLFRLFTGFAIAAVTASRSRRRYRQPRGRGHRAPLVRVLAPVPKIAPYLHSRLASRTPPRSLVVADGPPSRRHPPGRRRSSRSWRGRRAAGTAARPPRHRGAAFGAAVGADGPPDRPRDLLHRGAPGGDDHRPTARSSAGTRLAQHQTVDMFVPLITTLLGLLLNVFNALRSAAGRHRRP